MNEAVAVVLAAGSGERLGRDLPKAFVPLAGRTMLEMAAGSACRAARVGSLVVVAPAGWETAAREIVSPIAACRLVVGGPSRSASVRAALDAVVEGAEAIAIHDAARPFATPELFDAALAALDGWDGVVPVVPVADTVKRLRDDAVEGTEPRDGLALAQTPQAFRLAALRDAHARAEREGWELTDDATALERAGYRVRAIAGETSNYKITTDHDLARAVADLEWARRG